MSKIVSNRRLEILLFVLLLVIIFFVYLSTFYPDQGWGDDFAQYISQAINLVHGVSMENTGYIYSRYTPVLGPRAYPPGFPLLLAPVYAVFGFNIAAFQVLIVLLQIITLMVVYMLLRREVAKPTALILLLMMGLSPYFISFKRGIMSDVPFMLACLSFLLWVEITWKPKEFSHRNAAIAAVLVLLCYLIRTIGFVVLLSLVISDLLRTRRISRFTVWTIVYTIPLILMARILFGGGQESYLDQFAGYSLSMVTFNIKHYLLDSMRGFWAGPSIHFSNNLILPILWIAGIPLGIYGFIRQLLSNKKTLLVEMFFVLYLAIILVWPSVQELRFLYPILPLFLLYIGVGFEGILRQIQQRVSLRVMQAVAVVGALAILTIYAVRTSDVIQSEGLSPYGPYTAPAQDLFSFIQNQTDPQSVFVFYKPRALALYTGRRASTFPSNQPMDTAAAYLKEIHANYVVVMEVDVDNGNSNTNLQLFIDAHPAAFETLFSNVDFQVFRLNLDALS